MAVVWRGLDTVSLCKDNNTLTMDAFTNRVWSFGEVLTAVARVMSMAGGLQQEPTATRAFVRLFGEPKELAGIASDCDSALLSYHLGLLLVVSLLSLRARTLLAVELGGSLEDVHGDIPPHVSQQLFTLLKRALQDPAYTTFAEATAFVYEELNTAPRA